MKIIQDETGKKLVQKTSLAITEGGSSSELSYVQGGIVHQGIGVSATKTVATEEKPFVEIEELKGLPNNVAVVLPSNGDRTLPATMTYLRPLWVFKKYPSLAPETPWLDWPRELRATYDLDTMPQELSWGGWDSTEPLEEDAIVLAEERLGRFVQRRAPAAVPNISEEAAPQLPSTAEVTKPSNLLPPAAGDLPRVAPELPTIFSSSPPSGDDARPQDPPPEHPELCALSIRIHEDDLGREGDPFAGLPEDDI
jgi:hypothetical protein